MYKAKLKKEHGIRVVSATEPVSDDEGGEIYEMFLEWNDEKYSQRLSKRIKDGLATSIANGTYTGTSIVYGYKLVGTGKQGRKGKIHKVAIDEEQADVVRFIYNEYAKGTPKKEIADMLNAKGLRHRGQPFHYDNFERWIKNEKYTGEYDYGGQRISNIYPQIIDKLFFDKVQKMLAKNKKMSGANSAVEPYILTGKAFCYNCGTAMVAGGGTSHTGKKHYYYECRKKKRKLCTMKVCNKDNLEQAVTEYIIDCLRDPEILNRAVEDCMNFHEQRTGDDGLKSIDARIQNAKAESEQLTQSFIYARNEMLRASIEKKIDEIEIYLNDLNCQKAQIQLEHSFKITKAQIVEFIHELVKGDATDKNFQKRIVDRLLHKVYVGDGVFLAFVRFFKMNNVEQITFDDVNEATRSVYKGSNLNDGTLPKPSVFELQRNFLCRNKMIYYVS
jgi:hypothetical protein